MCAFIFVFSEDFFFLPTASMMYQYFVKIVPTIYVKTDGEVSADLAEIYFTFVP